MGKQSPFLSLATRNARTHEAATLPLRRMIVMEVIR